MIDVYLTTGFLGSGKTNFLKCFLMLYPDSKTAIIVNEFGKEGVDGKLLADLGHFLTEINNGSIFCSCKLVQFEDALDRMLDEAPDRIVIEASGLSDPTNVREVLCQERFKNRIRYCGAICVVDTTRFFKLWTVARVIKQQIAVSNLFLVNKIDLASAEQLEQTHYILEQMRPGAPRVETTFSRITLDVLAKLNPQGGRLSNESDDQQDDTAGEARIVQSKDLTLRKLLLSVSTEVTSDVVKHGVALFSDDTFRVKGFLRLKDGTYLFDGVGPHLEVVPYPQAIDPGNYLVVLYNNQMPARQSIEKAMTWLPAGVFSIE